MSRHVNGFASTRATRRRAPEVIYQNFYDFPHYYDLTFNGGSRREVEFLIQCFKRHARRDVRQVFEPGCGTGRLLPFFARHGFAVSGLDINDRAIDFCNNRLQRQGFSRAAILGDMASFRLAGKVDAAFSMINTFRLLTSGRQAMSHLRCMARALRVGGVYALGLHLTPVVGKPLCVERHTNGKGKLQLRTTVRTMGVDLRKRLEHVRITCHAKTPLRRLQIADDTLFRMYTLAQFRALLRRAAWFEIAATYDFTYQIDSPIRLEHDTQDVVVILRKRASC